MAVGRRIGGQLGEAGPVRVDHEDVLLLAVLGAPAEGDLAAVGRPGRRMIVARGNASETGAVGPAITKIPGPSGCDGLSNAMWRRSGDQAGLWASPRRS